MKNTKKLLSFLLVLTLFLTLFSCGAVGKETPDDQTDRPTDQSPLPPDADEEDGGKKDEEDKPELIPLTVKNETVSGLIPVRSRFYDNAALYTRLLTLEDMLQNKNADPALITSYLGSILRESEDVGLYYDYAPLLPLKDGEDTYGNRLSAGVLKNNAPKPTMVAMDEANLLAALAVAVPGDVIVIRDEIEIDMADLYTAGTVQNYLDKDSPSRLRIPAGVTLSGERGQNGKTGGVLKISCDTDLFLMLAENAKLDSLVIQGPSGQSGISFGILLAGDNTSINNCEIAGFAETAVKVASGGVTIKNSFFHNIQGEPGIAIALSNGSLTVENCLFSSVNTCVSVEGATSSLIFRDNLDAGNTQLPIFIAQGSGYDADYTAQTIAAESIVVENNTFLSPVPLFSIGGLPSDDFICRYNLFAYSPYFHNSGECDLAGVDDSIYEKRYICQNNVYNLKNPYIMYKLAGETKNGVATGSRPLEPLIPAENKAPDLTLFSSAPLPTAAFYPLEASPYAPLVSALGKKDTAGLKTALNTALERLTGLTRNHLHTLSAGGQSTQNRYTQGAYTVKNIYDLQFALISVQAGDVIFIPGDATIDFSNPDGTVTTLVIPEGVTLASDRGRVREDGSVSRGAILTSSVFTSQPLLDITLDDITLTGLSIVGVDPYTHYSHYNRAYEGALGGNSKRTYYNRLPTTTAISVSGNRFTMENCEVAGFSYGVSYVWKNPDSPLTSLITDCYFHHFQRKEHGLALTVKNTNLTLKNNLFAKCQKPFSNHGDQVCTITDENNLDLGGLPPWKSTIINFDDVSNP